VCSVTGSRVSRLWIAALVLAAAGTIAASAAATSHSATSLQAVNRGLLAAVNAFRVAHHLAPLRESPALDRSAHAHSAEMGRAGYFGHPSADGTSFWRRIQHYYGARNYSYWSVGENLLWHASTVNSVAAMKMWIASPEHLRNLLAPQWREIGVSAVHVVGAPGAFHGLTVTIVTTDFGARR
jgi:uncharacterized protein YkwD